jgi:hypothetical protein
VRPLRLARYAALSAVLGCGLAAPSDLNASDCGRAFAEIPSYPVQPPDSGIRQVIGADFNGDGRPDIAQIGISAASVSLSNPDGTFAAPIPFSADFGLDRIAVGDFDGNGKADLFYTGYQTVGTVLGNGNGTFTQGPTRFVDTTQAQAIVTGYFNDDSFLDVAVAAGGEARLFVFLGHGDGSFDPFVEYALGDQTNSIVAFDLNGDGKTDLVAADVFTGNLTILHGNGDGTFQPPVALPLNVPPNTTTGGLAVFDLDGNGANDLAVGSSVGIVVLLGDGAGGFGSPTTNPTEVSGGSVVIGDFDLDSIPDILTNGSPTPFDDGTPGLVLLHGNGDGTFSSARSFSTFSTDSLAVGDFNTDGKPDIVTAAGPDFYVLLHLSPGLYDVPRLAYNVFATPFPNSDLALYDLNGDGHLDAVLFGSGILTILLGEGTGRFAFRQTFTLAYNNGQPAIGQFNGDGFPDIAVGVGDSTVAVLLGHGDGSFADPVLYPIASTFPPVKTGRFDADAFDDIAVGYQNFPTEAGFHLLLSNGDGTFRDGGTVQTVGSAPRDAIATDLNGDGKTDIASVDGFSGLSVLLGNGDGTFQPAVPYAAGDEPDSVTAGDLTGDHILDLLVGNVNSSNLSLFPGVGNGTFLPPTTIASAVPPQAVHVADLDLDGKNDIVLTGGLVSSSGLTGIEVYMGAGGGTFESPKVTAMGIRPVFSQIGDVDGNGTPDVAYPLTQGYGFVVVPNSVLRASVSDASGIVHTPMAMTVSAAGLGSLTYQWRKNGLPLADGGPISGATTATLTIDPVAFTDAGSYDVVVTDSCTNVTSNAATLSVEFDDVPLDNPFHNDILTIATAGITSGCTLTSYCPANDVSRAEMAVFLLKSKYGADHVPPPPVQIFPDVPNDAFAAAWVDELATLNITTGCGGGLYCPDRPVSRAEMAVFLLKTLLGSGYVPPTPVGIFADVPLDSFAVDWIEDIYNRGITAGCATNPLRYCPDADVPREQMATFLVRTFLGP